MKGLTPIDKSSGSQQWAQMRYFYFIVPTVDRKGKKMKRQSWRQKIETKRTMNNWKNLACFRSLKLPYTINIQSDSKFNEENNIVNICVNFVFNFFFRSTTIINNNGCCLRLLLLCDINSKLFFLFLMPRHITRKLKIENSHYFLKCRTLKAISLILWHFSFSEQFSSFLRKILSSIIYGICYLVFWLGWIYRWTRFSLASMKWINFIGIFDCSFRRTF